MKHIFEASVQWSKPGFENASTGRIYEKSHRITISGKDDLLVSAAKAFKGDPNLYNPEDLLLSSLASCHMMSFLYVLSQHKIDILAYTDQAEATLETNNDGSGQIIEVRLFPKVIIADASKIELVNSLHQQANKLCFIANSCNFPVIHHATCEVAST